MKLRKIKNITIGSVKFNVIWDKKTSGGSFNYGKKEIMIGLKLGDLYAFSILIHELKEIIQVEQSTRFERRDEYDNYYFFYDHAQHTDICCRLGTLLDNFIV